MYARSCSAHHVRFLVWLTVFVALGCKTEPAPTPPAISTPQDAQLSAATTPRDAAQIALDASAATTAAERGAALYARMCAVCHGPNGEGYAADQATALAHPAFLASVSDDFLRFAIAVGRRGTTMSAWQQDHGGPLSEADVSDVVAHLRSWQKAAPVTFDTRGASGDSARGRALFKRECARCHGDKAPYVHILNRQFLRHATPGFLRHAIQSGRPPTEMPAFAQKLGERGVEDVVSYLRSLPSWPIPGEVPGSAGAPPLPLGPVPLHPRGPEPRGFRVYPETTSVDVVGPELKRGARMALLDARAPSDYAISHIAGAVSVPFYDPSPYLAALPKDAWLVCYCGCPHAESGALAKQLQEAGFRKVALLDEGLGVWTEKKYPLRSGTEP